MQTNVFYKLYVYFSEVVVFSRARCTGRESYMSIFDNVTSLIYGTEQSIVGTKGSGILHETK